MRTVIFLIAAMLAGAAQAQALPRAQLVHAGHLLDHPGRPMRW